MEEKDFNINVTLKFANCITAENKEQAIQIIKEQFKQDYNIELTDDEIEIMGEN